VVELVHLGVPATSRGLGLEDSLDRVGGEFLGISEPYRDSSAMLPLYLLFPCAICESPPDLDPEMDGWQACSMALILGPVAIHCVA